MTLRGCAREKDVAAMLRAGHWPAACGEELRAHVAGCKRCGDVVLVAETMQEAKRASRGARMDAAGVIWWRAQLRRRSEAMQAISRPMWGAQMFAMLLGVMAAAAALSVEVRAHGWVRMAGAVDGLGTGLVHALGLQGVASLLGSGTLLMVTGGGMLAMVSGLVVYLTTDRR